MLAVPVLPALSGDGRRRAEGFARYLLAVAFLAHESALVVDAVLRVSVRMSITRKHLLEWTSAAHTAFGLGARSPRAVLWREMYSSPLLALAVAALVAWLRPSALAVAAPFLATWLLAPEIARWVSRPPRARDEPLRAVDRQKLRRLARRTWHFFETFVGPGDQWLPVDNYQAEPREQIAHRTSPTNIGMMLLSTLSAYDLGYVGPGELSLRLRNSFDTIARLSHYQGHLLNWYETKNLQPLLPRYVSTVDSGNFAGCLLALAQGCKDAARSARAPDRGLGGPHRHARRAPGGHGLDGGTVHERARGGGRADPARARGAGAAHSSRRLRGRASRSATTPRRSSTGSSSRCSKRARTGTKPRPSMRFERGWTTSTSSCSR